MYNDITFQVVINKYGIEGAWQLVLNEFLKMESLKQPSPNIELPTIATNTTAPPV
jgi:hypothetical protein